MTSLLTVDESVDRHDLTELLDAVASVRVAVARLVDERLPVTAGEVAQGRTVDGALSSLPSGSQRLARVISRFGLDRFETGLLLLCAGAEVDAELAGLLSRAAGPGRSVLPTFQLAMASLPGGHWRAIGPGSPLRRWRMIEVGPGDSLLASPLRISERLLMHLIGVDQLDERLAGVVRPGAHGVALDAAYHRAAERLASAWAGEPGLQGLTDGPVVLLVGGDIDVHPAIVADACTLLGLTRYDLNETALPSQAHELDALSRLWEREALLCDAALLVNIEDVGRDTARDGILGRFLRDTGGCIAVSGDRSVGRLLGRDVVTITVPRAGNEERRAAWEAGLAEAGLPAGCADHQAAVTEFLARYRLSPLEVRAACRQAARSLSAPEQSVVNAEIVSAVNEACAGRVHPRMDGLADRIDTTAGWDDLVLPEPQKQMLRGIARRVRHRNRVLTGWGFAGFRGTAGVNALFAGPSGTGKTMAAGVVAGELGLELYRVDLSGVVDKYIGETEKNLSRIFAAAQRSGAVLFFDEADALFGRRSEVRDSHDRYANIQVSHLLQRMDSYDGLAILATNLSTAMDSAFLRRLTYVVRFPFPDAEQRRQMWRNAFPAQTPTVGLDDEKLATLLVSGGSIRNIALAAAFRAADADVPVGMNHLLMCAVEECQKHERPVLPAEVQGWV